jgi:hypothetical protein
MRPVRAVPGEVDDQADNGAVHVLARGAGHTLTDQHVVGHTQQVVELRGLLRRL